VALEIEAKFRLADLEPLRQRLRECGARRLGAVLETNQYFDFPSGKLRSGDRGLRLRVAEPTNADAAGKPVGSSEVRVTYKGPRHAGALKIREELEFRADDATAVAEVLQALGLAATLAFQKRRESWELDGCRVELDELPILGRFMEIEGPSGQAIAAVAEKLQAADLPMEQTPYSVMLHEHIRRAGLPGGPITF
jgi:adenylate cyclase class 2